LRLQQQELTLILFLLLYSLCNGGTLYLRIPQVSGGLGAKIQFQLRVGEAFKWSTTRNGTASTTTIAHAKVNILYIFLLFKSPSNCLSNDRKETNTKEVKEGSLQFEVGHFYVTIRVKGFFYHMAIRPPNALASGYFWNMQVERLL